MMALLRVATLMVLGFLAVLLIDGVNAQEANTSVATSTTDRTFATTIQTFATAAETRTYSLPEAPEQTRLVDYAPLYDQEVSPSVSYTIRLSPENGFVAICWYPISGQYGLLPRILFYVTILIALVVRRHQWLYAGALVSALTYSGVAAIHACLLVWRGPTWGELDLPAILAILSTSCIITVPLLNWSSTLRNIGKNENEIKRNAKPEDKQEQEFDSVSRTIILYWALLVTVGFLCVFIAMINWIYSENPKYWNFTTVGGPSQIYCAPENGTLDTSAGQNALLGEFLIDQEFIDTNHCTDPCTSAHPLLGGEAIFRSEGDLVVVDEQRILRFSGYGNTRQNRNMAFVGLYLIFGLVSLPYILLQGAWAVLFGRRTPGQARNVVYALLTRLRLSRSRSQLQPAPLVQRGFAKFFAVLSYLWAVFILVICIPIIIINFTALELLLWVLPAGENAIHVGAWGPWAATGVALVATFFAKYNEDIKYVLLMGAYKTAWLAVHPSWPFLQLNKGQNRDEVPAWNFITREYETMPDRKLLRRTAEKVVGGAMGKSSNYTDDKIWWFFGAVTGEWRQFREFWKDPDFSRANQGRVHRLEINNCKCLLNCDCAVQSECSHDDFCRPDHKCTHEPRCKHTRACKRERRLRILNPERVGINMLIPSMHGKRFRLDVVGKPIPLRDHGQSLQEPTVLYPISATDYKSVRSTDSDEEDEKDVGMRGLIHSQDDRETRPASGRLSRFFGFARNSRGSDKSKKPGRRGLVAQVLQPSQPPDVDATLEKTKDGGFVVREEPIHPALRESYHDSYHTRQPSRAAVAGTNHLRPSIYSINEGELISHEQSLRKHLPPTPTGAPPRVPHTSPDESVTEFSPITTASPIQTRGEPVLESRSESRSDGPSPDSHPDSHPSESSMGVVSPQSDSSPPRNLFPAPPNRVSLPPPTHIASQLRSSTAGLMSSLEQAAMQRQRRSTVYSSTSTSDATPSTHCRYSGPHLIVPTEASRAQLGLSSEAPIPVHLESLTPFAEAPGDESYFSHGQTPSDLAASMPFSPGADDLVPPSYPAATTAPTTGVSSPSNPPPTPPPKNTPPTLAHRHTLPPSLQAPIPPVPRLPLLQDFTLPPINLNSPQRPSATNDESGTSTPAILLPLLSPPDPNSNTAQAQSGSLDVFSRNPNMVTPAGARGSGAMRDPMSAAGSRVQSLEGVHEEGQTSAAIRITSLEGVTEGVSSTAGKTSAVEEGSKVERTQSPRPPGYRSTVSYLQVQRPTTMMFADEITLRKDEFGVYRLVYNGEDKVG